MFPTASSLFTFWFWLCSDRGILMEERKLSGKEKNEKNAVEVCNESEKRKLPKIYQGTVSFWCAHLSNTVKDGPPSYSQEMIEWVGGFE